jgi:hypothetical protein
MAASVLRVTGIGKDGAVLLSMEPHWWDIKKLEERVQLTWLSTSEPGYNDLDADITLDQAKTLHEQFKPKLLELIETNSEAAESTKHLTENLDPPRENAYAKYVRELRSDLAELDAAFAENSSLYSRFHLLIYEWD